MLSVLTILAPIHKLNHNYGYISLSPYESAIIDEIIAAIPMIIFLYVFPPFFGAWPSLMIIATIAPIISNFIYYNPEGKHCIVKSKSTGKYIIFSFNYILPNPDYILQHLGESNKSEFNSEQQALNAILKLDNMDDITSNLSEKTLSKYEEWLRGLIIALKLEQDNDLAFTYKGDLFNKGDVFKQIFKRNDRGIIIASFSEKTLSEYEEWLRGVNYRFKI
jgi:hypothetical protein